MFVREESGTFTVKPEDMYPVYLDYVREAAKSDLPITQYSLEQARMCFTEDLFQVFGPGIHLHILRNESYALKNFPLGAEERFVGVWAPGIYKNLPGTPATRLKIVN